MKNIFRLNFTTFNTFLFFIALFLFILLLSGCEDNGTDPYYPDEISYLRILHQSSSGDELDFTYEWINSGNEFGWIHGMDYDEQYGYYAFESSPLIIRAYFHNTSIVASSDTLELSEDKSYSIFANDYSASINPQLMTYEDTKLSPQPGKVLVRFINLGTDADVIDITTNDESLINGLNKYEASQYVELDEGTYQFNIYNYGENILQMSPVTFNENLIYTIVFSGSISGLTDVQFEGKVLQDTNS